MNRAEDHVKVKHCYREMLGLLASNLSACEQLRYTKAALFAMYQIP